MAKHRHRLSKASGIWTALEPGGGLTASVVTTGTKRGGFSSTNNLEEDDVPEEQIIGVNNHADYNPVELTHAQLDAIASNDVVADVLERICSYIAVVDNTGGSFAYADLADTYKATDAIARDRTIEAIKWHWNVVQTLLFSNFASKMLGIQNFLQAWLTYGKLWVFIVRKKQYGEVLAIKITVDKPVEFNVGHETYWKVGNLTIYEEDDIFELDYRQISRYHESYIASIRRAFNFYTAIERTRIANAIMTAQFRSIYTVPTKGLGKTAARKRMSTIMGLYKRDVRIDDSSGQIQVNGENNWPVNTDLWVAETGAGKVDIQNPGDGNVSLNNTDLVEYFMRKFYKKAKLPMSKYEAVDTGYLSGLGELDEDERQFRLCISAHQAILSKFFSSIVWRLMSVLPDYAGDTELQQSIKLSFYVEPKHETPAEELDGQSDKLDKINDMCDKLGDTLEQCGFGDLQKRARINALRVKLMRKYCPELLEQTLEDYRNVSEEESAMDDDDWSSSNDSSSTDWQSGSTDDWGDSGTDDFSDSNNDDWDSSFSQYDNMGDDWSMPDDSGMSDW